MKAITGDIKRFSKQNKSKISGFSLNQHPFFIDNLGTLFL